MAVLIVWALAVAGQLAVLMLWARDLRENARRRKAGRARNEAMALTLKRMAEAARGKAT